MNAASKEELVPVRLLIIDDSQPSRLVQTLTIEEHFENVDVTSRMQPPAMEEILAHDGVMLDERLIGESGMDVAARIHQENWRIPLMIMTSLLARDEVFIKAYESVDYVATKSDPQMAINVLRAFIRQMRRIKIASQATP